ncbi:hypothetical protein [Sporosarcina sp. BP05]|uniref:hypothetical protein n=1 Tax=Sporosarcina sp. BP05 TaxID=2758726 RepID=UPI001645A09B|nr:hypothetical protein [Sporosarcina sp. BP05]
MDVWTVPLITVALIISIIGFIAVMKWRKASVLAEGPDNHISGPIEEHPFNLNPIIWIVLVAVLFIGIVIFYYAASS